MHLVQVASEAQPGDWLAVHGAPRPAFPRGSSRFELLGDNPVCPRCNSPRALRGRAEVRDKLHPPPEHPDGGRTPCRVGTVGLRAAARRPRSESLGSIPQAVPTLPPLQVAACGATSGHEKKRRGRDLGTEESAAGRRRRCPGDL